VIDLAAARETFEAATDLTVGIEEEFALLDPATLGLVPAFEQLRDAGLKDERLVKGVMLKVVVAGNNKTAREVHIPERKKGKDK
jgi:gamma-glutamyl:cysteine ligase YbdK (ATP-grasp superfamily)